MPALGPLRPDRHGKFDLISQDMRRVGYDPIGFGCLVWLAKRGFPIAPAVSLPLWLAGLRIFILGWVVWVGLFAVGDLLGLSLSGTSFKRSPPIPMEVDAVSLSLAVGFGLCWAVVWCIEVWRAQRAHPEIRRWHTL